MIFGTAHWLLFVILIGVRRTVNPFGLGISTFRSTSGWQEQIAEVQTQEVGGAFADDDELSENEADIIDVTNTSMEFSEDDQDMSESDQDDITDIQPSFQPNSSAASLRNRLSRGSVRSGSSPTAHLRYDTFR